MKKTLAFFLQKVFISKMRVLILLLRHFVPLFGLSVFSASEPVLPTGPFGETLEAPTLEKSHD